MIQGRCSNEVTFIGFARIFYVYIDRLENFQKNPTPGRTPSEKVQNFEIQN